MEMLKILTKEKQSAETPNMQIGTSSLGGTSGDTPYPQGFALPRETQATYASPSNLFLSTAFSGYEYHEISNARTKGIFGLMDPLVVPDLDELAEKGKSLQDKAIEKYELLEERMRAMEGINILGSLDATELSLVSGLIIPHKFKTPIFDKYDGTKCPTTHFTMYCQKMSA